MKSRRVWAEINLDAITSNLRRVRQLAGEDKGVMAIIKANAYGHGAVPIAWHLASEGVNALGVGDSQEAIELRWQTYEHMANQEPARFQPAH